VLKGEADPLAEFPNIARWFKSVDARHGRFTFQSRQGGPPLAVSVPSNTPVLIGGRMSALTSLKPGSAEVTGVIDTRAHTVNALNDQLTAWGLASNQKPLSRHP